MLCQLLAEEIPAPLGVVSLDPYRGRIHAGVLLQRVSKGVRGQPVFSIALTFLHSEVKMSSKKNKIRPLQDRIIVERLAPEEKSSGGIILPDNAQERPQRGRVIAVGKGKVREDGTVTPVDVKEGDEILFGKYSGTEVKVDGAEVLIMREDDVLGVVL